MDLMTRMCVRPTAALLKEQLAIGKQHMPRGMPMHEVWTQTMNDPHAIRTFNDALYFIFVFLVACPGYTRYVCERTNRRTMAVFLPVLRSKFETLMLGRAAGGKRAATPNDKEFQGSIDFTMAMRSRFLRC
jgi:hypothetical protein